MSTPLTAFVDELPLPRRLRATDHGGRITVAMCLGRHRVHRDLPESTVWGYDGTAPRPDDRGRTRATVEWRNELSGAFPVVALVERELDGEPNMLTMRELAPAADDHAGPVVTSREESGRRAIGSLPPSSRTRQPSSRC